MAKYFKNSELECHGKTCGPCHKLPTKELQDKLDQIREAYGKPISLNCAMRCPIHNAETPGAAPKSKHMEGNAADVSDVSGEFKKWIQPRLEFFGLWMEDPKATSVWCHIQIVPYPGWKKGMARTFKP